MASFRSWELTWIPASFSVLSLISNLIGPVPLDEVDRHAPGREALRLADGQDVRRRGSLPAPGRSSRTADLAMNRIRGRPICSTSRHCRTDDRRPAGGLFPGDLPKRARRSRSLRARRSSRPSGFDGFRPLDVAREIVEEDRLDVVFVPGRSVRRREARSPPVGRAAARTSPSTISAGQDGKPDLEGRFPVRAERGSDQNEYPADSRNERCG